MRKLNEKRLPQSEHHIKGEKVRLLRRALKIIGVGWGMIFSYSVSRLTLHISIAQLLYNVCFKMLMKKNPV